LLNIGTTEGLIMCTSLEWDKNSLFNFLPILTRSHIFINSKAVKVLIWTKKPDIQGLQEMSGMQRETKEKDVISNIIFNKVVGNM
jgi:hypothetical protein